MKCQIPGKEYREAFLRDITSEQKFQRFGIAELGTITEQTFIPSVLLEIQLRLSKVHMCQLSTEDSSAKLTVEERAIKTQIEQQ